MVRTQSTSPSYVYHFLIQIAIFYHLLWIFLLSYLPKKKPCHYYWCVYQYCCYRLYVDFGENLVGEALVGELQMCVWQREFVVLLVDLHEALLCAPLLDS